MPNEKTKNVIFQILDLYLMFVKIGTFTIGGGLAMMPIMKVELVERKHWITEEELIDYFAVGQSTPGIIAVNVSTFVGYKQLGILGGIIGTLGIVTPSFFIIMLLAEFINSVSDYPIAQKALKGINVAVAALLTHVIYSFAKKTIKASWHLLLLFSSFIAVAVFKIPSVYVILFVISAGCISVLFTMKKSERKESDKSESAE